MLPIRRLSTQIASDSCAPARRALLAAQATACFRRIARCVQTGHDNNPVSLDSIVETVRETLDEEPTGVSIVDWMSGGEGLHGLKRVIDGVKEQVPMPRALNVVPAPSRLDVGECIGEEPERRHKISRAAGVWPHPT
jgi:hypothetical protein